MQTNIIQIGNSKGLRLSKTILKKYDIQDKVEIILEKDHIIIKPSSNPRADWEKQFAKMAKQGHDELLLPDVFEDEDFEEWK
jgi:antitoxin MazE